MQTYIMLELSGLRTGFQMPSIRTKSRRKIIFCSFSDEVLLNESRNDQEFTEKFPA